VRLLFVAAANLQSSYREQGVQTTRSGTFGCRFRSGCVPTSYFDNQRWRRNGVKKSFLATRFAAAL
jgi:hypothetical protein